MHWVFVLIRHLPAFATPALIGAVAAQLRFFNALQIQEHQAADIGR